MKDKPKTAPDRAQTEAETAVARKSLFADLKRAAQAGRDDRGVPRPR